MRHRVTTKVNGREQDVLSFCSRVDELTIDEFFGCWFSEVMIAMFDVNSALTSNG